jgi:two-component system, NtrC family, response regulator HydG
VARETTVPATGFASASVRERTAVRGYTCQISGAETPAQAVALGARALVVGTDARCDVVVSDPKVSRRHLELSARPDGIHVKDLGSKNGTYIDLVNVTEARVPAGTVIRAGDTTFKVVASLPVTVPPSARTSFGRLVGESLAMRELFAILELASPTDATILLQGESGTGKEIAARSIHDHSKRADKPFVIVDSSAANDELIESQLFGHVRGAFTGAISDRKGAFVEADGGTLFIDEIGELSLEAQARLLRALEAQTIQPLGADRPRSVDTRIIAATHRDLYTMVSENRFRFDLFHRLAVVHASIPPLRDRLEDLEILVRHLSEGRGFEVGPIEGPPLEVLHGHRWPGNVRELRNVLDRAWVLSGPNARFSDLQIAIHQPESAPYAIVDTHVGFKVAKERWVASFERRYIAAIYARFGGNLSRAAEHAGLTRAHFRALLDGHDLREK